MSGEFEGRTAAVTGAARGIGLAVARRLAAGGGAVALWDRDGAALEQADGFPAGARVHRAVVDVTDPGTIAAAVEATEAALGPIDILVNNAGIAGPNHPVWEYPVDAWNDVIGIDLTGVFLCCRAVVGGMVERGYGRVVNVASIAGKEGNPTASGYSAAKAGVIGLTKSLGKETAETGVLVNCVTPAVIETEILAQVSERHIEYMLSKIPMNRLGQADEVAELVAWLSSEACSFSTGAVFDISGGRATY